MKFNTPDRPIELTRRRFNQLLGSTAASAGVFAPGVARTDNLIPLRIMGSGNGWSASEIVVLAEEFGFFRKEGLRLDLIILPPERLTIALEGGITDFIPNAYYIYFLNIRDKGMKARQVVSTTPYLDARLPSGGLFVREDSRIREASDLRGKTIGVTVLQFASAWFTLAYAARAGLKREDLNLTAIPGPHHQQVLTNGDVDAVYTIGAVEATLLKKGEFRRLFATSDLVGRRISLGSTIVKEEFMKSNPDVVRRYVTAIGNTIEWANRSQDEIVRYAIKNGKVNSALAPYLYSSNGSGDYSALRWPDHGLQDRDDVNLWIEMAENIGIANPRRFKAEDIYTDRFNPYAPA